MTVASTSVGSARITRRVNRRRLLRAGLRVSLGSGLLVLAACGGEKTMTSTAPAGGASAAGSPQAAGAPRRGGRVAYTCLNSPNLNPVTNWAEGWWLSGSNVYDRLITSREDERLYDLEAARSVEQPDPLTIIFKLKPNLRTHNLPPANGRLLTAEDIVATQKYVRDVPNAYDANFQRNYMASVEAPDTETVVFKLRRPNAYVFGSQMLGINTSQVIIPRELLEKDLNTTPPVGSGPWYLAEYQINTRYLFKRFDGWREADQGKPYIDEREVFRNEDPIAQEAMFRAGQIHVFNPIPANVDRLVKELEHQGILIQKTGVNPVAFWMNMERDYPWQKDWRIRKAFWRMMNRQQILDLVYRGKGVLPVGLVPAGLKDWQLDPNETEEYQKFDPKEAKQLLDAAGWDYNQEYEITQRQAALNQQLAQVFQQQAAAVGVKLRIREYPFQEWLPNYMAQRRYQLVLEPSPGDETPGRTIRFLHSTTTNQNSGFGLHDPELDALIEKSEETLDRQENIKLVKEIQRKALAMWSSSRLIVTPDVLTFVNRKLQNWYVPAATILKYRTDAWFSE